MSGGWKSKVALAIGAAAAIAYSLTRPREFHTSVDAGFGRRCPSCQVASGQDHLEHCDRQDPRSARLAADGKTRQQKPRRK